MAGRIEPAVLKYDVTTQRNIPSLHYNKCRVEFIKNRIKNEKKEGINKCDVIKPT